MDVRLRTPELLKQRKLSAYRLAKDSGGRISMSVAYRLARPTGGEKAVAFDVLAALCDVLKVSPNELFSRDDEKPPPAARPAKPTRKGQG
jgi:DNA-binding Xre family transcriptional regulator